MDLKNNALVAWGVAGVLALILIIMLVMDFTRGPVNFNDVRRTIISQCRETDEASMRACRRSLELLGETLIDVDQELTRIREAAPATTTPEMPEGGVEIDPAAQ